MSFCPLPSSTGDDNGKFHGKSNSSPPTKSFSSSSDWKPKSPLRSSGVKKSRDRSRPRSDTRVRPKRSTYRAEAKHPASKKKKNSRKTGASESKSKMDIEELLAQTYPKDPLVIVDETQRSKGPEKPSEPAKDSANKWLAEEEMNLTSAFLASCAEDQINMTAFYERAKETFPSESRSHIYEKMRRMRSRFWTIETQIRDSKTTEDFYPYRSSHEGDLYKVWKCIWGHHERGTEVVQDMEMEQNRELGSLSNYKQTHNGDANDGHHESRIEASQAKEIEQNGESDAHVIQAHNEEVNKEPHEEDEEEYRQAEEDGQTVGKAAYCTAWNHDEEFNIIQKEIKALVRKVKNDVQTMLDDTQARTEGLVDKLSKRASAAAQVQSLRSEIGIGTCVCLSLSRRMKELQGVWSVKEFSGLDEAEAQKMKQKWRNHQIEELRAFSGRLELLKEECKLCIKDLETTNVNHKS